MCVPKVIRSVSEVAPVPPSPTANVPVIEEAAKSTASLLDSITKPPFVFASMATVGVPLSAAAPAVIPSPPVIDVT